MMRKISFLTILMVIFVISGFTPTICGETEAAIPEYVLARDNATDYVIVLRENPIPSESNAAGELQKYLKEISGAEFPIVPSEQTQERPCIFIGAGEAVKKNLPDLPWDTIADDRIVIKTVGKDVILAGSRPRGTLFAVYAFLEETLGCRWWTATESYIPTRSELTLPKLDIDYTPVFKRLRSTYAREVLSNPEFCAKLRCLLPGVYYGHYDNLYGHEEKWGGGAALSGYHTFYKLIPPSKYFSTHPAWFSLIRGKRTHKKGQLCLTNVGLLQEVIKNAREILAKDPDSIIVISQEDQMACSRCTCKKCLAVEQEEGSMSGPIIRFVNKVAKDIEEDYPNARILTFAYRYSQRPPQKVKPHKNVIVMLCSIKALHQYPLNSNQNMQFYEDLKGWNAITKELFIWDYRANFGNYLQINPDFKTLQNDLRLFAKNSVIGVFEQGDRNCEIGDFVKMRAWVTAHMLWDPKLSQSQLMQEFLNGYYQEAGPFLWNYLKLVYHIGRKGTFSPTPDVLLKAAKFYQKALNAVKQDEKLTLRVLRARTSLETSTLQLALLGVDVGDVIKALGYRGRQELLNAFKTKCETYKDSYYVETGNDRNLPYLAARYEKIASTLKEKKAPVIPGVDIDKFRWIDIQEESLGAHVSSPAKHVSDAEASNGKASLMEGNKGDWNLMYIMQGGLLDACHITRPTIYISAKVLLHGSPDPDETAFSIGIHNSETNKTTEKMIKYKEIQGPSYQFYRLENIPVDKNCYIWACASGKNVKQILFDRIILVSKIHDKGRY